MKHAEQTSESVELALFLALSGGVMDAYSYLVRGHVFANAQTGNMLLLGVNLSQGNWDQCVRYLSPVLFFSVGIAVAHGIKLLLKPKHLHWRQLVLLMEAVFLVIVGFVPEGSISSPTA